MIRTDDRRPPATRYQGDPTAAPVESEAAACRLYVLEYKRIRRGEAAARPQGHPERRSRPGPGFRSTAFEGVILNERGRYRAWVSAPGRQFWIGTFATAEQARDARARWLAGEGAPMMREIHAGRGKGVTP